MPKSVVGHLARMNAIRHLASMVHMQQSDAHADLTAARQISWLEKPSFLVCRLCMGHCPWLLRFGTHMQQTLNIRICCIPVYTVTVADPPLACVS